MSDSDCDTVISLLIQENYESWAYGESGNHDLDETSSAPSSSSSSPYSSSSIHDSDDVIMVPSTRKYSLDDSKAGRQSYVDNPFSPCSSLFSGHSPFTILSVLHMDNHSSCSGQASMDMEVDHTGPYLPNNLFVSFSAFSNPMEC
eukprot:TRINITY_DN15461_c0_g1::TRINITY_DN15461_c0_g1_i1::g.30474::m.30474 TRINITY_DN15461_c0_g1::TRINITY_DN15461_c0_g1_i1::g.30474  ORF type:complete len:145 (+),score=4.54 TRINITY_DN15461_c0_g1_i1:103-537(+)